MIITNVQLKQILSSGGSLIIDGSSFNLSQLKQFAIEAAKSNVTINIKNASNITPDNLQKIALIAPGQITFDFT